MGSSLVMASGGYSLLTVRGLLAAVTSLVVELGLWDSRASVVEMPRFQWLQHVGSVAVALGL